MNQIETRNLKTDYVSQMTNDERLVSDTGYYAYLRLSDNMCCYDSAAHIRKMEERGIKILILPMEHELYSYGKAADWVLKDNPRVLSVYIEAPRSYCRPRIMEQMGVTAETADISITETDKYRAEYYAYYTGGNYWTNPVNYDLTLNTARLGIQGCVDMIKYALQMKFPDLKQE